MKRIYYVYIALGTLSHGMWAEPDWKASLQLQKQELLSAHKERVRLTPLRANDSAERIERYGELIWFDNAEATILLCHGFLCCKQDISGFRNLFPWGRFNFLSFDFRGHGEACEDQHSTLGRDEVLDVISAGEFLKQDTRTQGKPVFVWAFSMGAVAAIGAQAQRPLFEAMILDCPYDSTENLVHTALNKVNKWSVFGYEFGLPGQTVLEQYKFHPYVQSFLQAMLRLSIRWDTRHVTLIAASMNPVELAEQIKIPCFFIHCKNDEKVPIEAVKRVYEAVPAPKQLWITNGRGHFDSYFYNPEQYTHQVRRFIESVLHNDLQEFKEPRIVEEEDETII